VSLPCQSRRPFLFSRKKGETLRFSKIVAKPRSAPNFRRKYLRRYIKVYSGEPFKIVARGVVSRESPRISQANKFLRSEYSRSEIKILPRISVITWIDLCVYLVSGVQL
jgi:hypothetical protein